MNWKNILERALWTFLEGFLVALPSAVSLGLDGAAWKAGLFAAVCAGVSAVKTVIVDAIQHRLDELSPETSPVDPDEIENEEIISENIDESSDTETDEEIPSIDPLDVEEAEDGEDASI